ncbi:helix-turn-helix domain-containing protein [Mycobacterium scrofulaceum]|uniref:helix-turn-helix domain-containing protein n=1 Tax=Mycobacterium scrofulaceum TaxID=1783 RepID=UPI0009EF5916|nr:helix-turn-helix domain-containing protein [Mycobacterium scrofulaceum]
MSTTTKPVSIPLQDVRGRYGIPYSTVRQWIREGRLKGYRVAGGRQVYIRTDELEALFVPTHSD